MTPGNGINKDDNKGHLKIAGSQAYSAEVLTTNPDVD